MAHPSTELEKLTRSPAEVVNVHTHQPVAGDLLLFPSWLPHRVEASTTDAARLSISFNVCGAFDGLPLHSTTLHVTKGMGSSARVSGCVDGTLSLGRLDESRRRPDLTNLAPTRRVDVTDVTDVTGNRVDGLSGSTRDVSIADSDAAMPSAVASGRLEPVVDVGAAEGSFAALTERMRKEGYGRRPAGMPERRSKRA